MDELSVFFIISMVVIAFGISVCIWAKVQHIMEYKHAIRALFRTVSLDIGGSEVDMNRRLFEDKQSEAMFFEGRLTAYTELQAQILNLVRQIDIKFYAELKEGMK